ncbi:MAG: ATP-binding cassette domain-containing protein [Bacteroidales bacterium]|nr:ATP-binding cassette domain-containing protein [Bacteroidales bacterium]
MEKILEINNLHKNYGKIKAVQDLSLTVEAGTVFGLLGPNGSGKTTTLGIVLDVVRKTKGTYSWFGEDPGSESRKKIGAILEGPAFYPYLSAEENLKVTARIKCVPYDRIEKVLKTVNLHDRKDDKFQSYSLGMKQRLSIAAALLSDPYVLVLDEPTNGLDPQGIADVRELIVKISGEGKTIILASHLLDEVQKVCTHFAVLNKGKNVYTGSVDEALSNKEIVEVSAPDRERLSDLLKECPYVSDFTMHNKKTMVRMEQHKTAHDLNAFLVSHNLVLSHLVTEKKNLEEQFLEILSQSS